MSADDDRTDPRAKLALPYRVLFEALGDPAAVCDPDERLVLINRKAESLFGISADDVLGRSFFDLLPADERERMQQRIEQRRQGDEEAYELRIIGPEGAIREVMITAAPLFDESGEFRGSLGVFHDISPVKRAEEEARRSEERYRKLFEQMLSGFVILEVVRGDEGALVDLRFGECNPAFEPVTGLEWSRIRGQSVGELFGGADTQWLAELQRVAETGVAAHFVRFSQLLGRHLEVLVYRPEADRLAAIFNDVSDRVRSEDEKRDLEAQLAQAQKMEAIGRLAGGVAHDINNVLGAIMGSASALAGEVTADVQRADVETIIAACRKGGQLTRNLLGFARKGKYLKETVWLNGVVQRLEELLRRTLSKKIDIRLQLDQSLQPIAGDLSQLENALMNICINAADAMRDGGRLEIETGDVKIADESRESLFGLKPGRYARVRVRDTGCGMDHDILERAFEPFYTTKPLGQGTGLGLSMVYGVVQNHGGSVTIESEPGCGTIVSVMLPVAEVAQSKPLAATPSQLPAEPGGRVGVLLVDDEPLVIRSTKRMLERLGYTVFTAVNGREAVAVYRQRRNQIALVVLDFLMPEMDGAETLSALLDIDSDARVVMATGFTEDAEIDALLARGACGLVRKPFDMKILGAELGRALAVRSD